MLLAIIRLIGSEGECFKRLEKVHVPTKSLTNNRYVKEFNESFTMCDDAEVLARGCGHLYDLDIRRCPQAIQNNTTCPPTARTRVRYTQDDHDGKCKSCVGQSPPDSTW